MLKSFRIKRYTTFLLMAVYSLWSLAALSGNKQVTAIIGKNDPNYNEYYFFFSDSTVSDFSIKDKKFMEGEFGNRSVNNFTYNGTWPKNADGTNKRVTAIVNNVFYPKENTYFFSDGTRANFIIENQSFNTNTDSSEQWWHANTAWPKQANGKPKQVIAIAFDRLGIDDYYFFFNDSTVSNFSISSKTFLDNEYGNRSVEVFSKGTWPKNANGQLKKISAIITNPFNAKQDTYFFSDGTSMSFDRSEKELINDPNSEKQWSAANTNWPTKPEEPTKPKEVFNPAAHEIEDVLINPGQNNSIPSCIYPNGRMQIPVHIWVRIRDKNLNNYVEISDLTTIKDMSLITLYDRNEGAEAGRESFLDIDGINDSQPENSDFSKTWQVSRQRNQFDMVMPARDCPQQSPPPSITTDVKNFNNSDGWNRFTYYVTATQTDPAKQLCAQIGVPGSYTYSCENNSSEYTTIKGIPMPKYGLLNFDYEQVQLLDSTSSDGFKVVMHKLMPKERAFNIHSVASENLVSYTTDGQSLLIDKDKNSFLISAQGSREGQSSAIYAIAPGKGNKTFRFPMKRGDKWLTTKVNVDSDDGAIYLPVLSAKGSLTTNPLYDSPQELFNSNIEFYDNFGNIAYIDIRKSNDGQTYQLY